MKHQKSHLQINSPLYRYARGLVRPFLDILGQLESHGVENIPKQGGVVLVSNHVSYVDPVIIATVTSRELHFIGAEKYFRVPVFGWLLTKLNGFPVKRGTPDLYALKKTLSCLKAGKALLIFPEGTRSDDGTLGEMHNGVSFILHHSNVPAIPVFIRGAECFMPRGAKFIRPAKLSVTFGTPIDFTTLERADRKQELYKRMNKQIREAILSL